MNVLQEIVVANEERFMAPDVDALYSAAAIAAGHHTDKAECMWHPSYGCAVLRVHSGSGGHRFDVEHLHLVCLDSWKFAAPHG